MTNTSNIKSRFYPDQTKLELITSLQFDEPHSSLALNRNIHGLVPHGIYQGFDVSLAGGMDLLIGGANFGAAVAKHADVSLTIHQQGNKTVTLAAGEKQYVVIDSFFQYGVRTKQVDVLASKHAAEYKVVKTPGLLPHHVVIACVDIPGGATKLTDSMIVRSERSVGGWGIAEHINQYDPHPQYLQKSHAAVEAEIDAKSPSLLKYINLSMLWRALAKLLGDSKTYTDTEVKASYTKVIGEAKAFTIKKHDEQQIHFEDEHNTAISYTDTKLTEAKAFATQKHNEQQAYVNTEVGKVHTFAQSLHDTQQNYINQQVAAVVGANVPDDLNSIRELIAEIQSNETAINVMRNIQAKKLDKTATAANTLLFGGKTYDQAKSEFRSGLITSQRAVSDSVTSNSSVIAASLKGLNTAYKKAVSAYDLAASKMSQAVADARYLKKTDSAPKLGGQIPDYYLSGSSKEYVDIIVGGDANKYYPVSLSQNIANGYSWGLYNIGRAYNWQAPSSWHTSSHKGGLTLGIEWSGDTSWGGNNQNIRVSEFDESYSTMVGGIGLSKTKGLIIWLRGGGATYRVTTPRGKEESPTIHHGGLVDSGDSFPVKDYDAAFVKQTVTDRQPVRNYGELFDRGERVYSPHNKPTASDVGALGKSAKAVDSSKLEGNTKSQVVAEARAGKVADSNKLGGRTRAQIISEARQGRMQDGGTYGTVTLSNWVRTNGKCGWYSNTYGGGIYMTDGTWIRTYGGKRFYCDSTANDAIQSRGGVYAGGNVTAYSDIRVKDDIKVITDALNKVCKIRGVTFTRTDRDDGLRQTGVIAQELEKVLPEAVLVQDNEHNGIEDFRSVAYGNVVGLLIEAIKEEVSYRQEAEKRISDLEKRLDKLAKLMEV